MSKEMTTTKPAKMSASEKKYAVERIGEVLRVKQAAVYKANEIPAKTLSKKKKYDMIKKGEVPLKPRDSQNNYGHLSDFFDFSKHESVAKRPERCGVLIDRLEKKAAAARDQIMLGDSAEALRLIQELESFNVK